MLRKRQLRATWGLIFLYLAMASAHANAQTLVELWYHSGQEQERKALRENVNAFNASHPEIKLKPVEIPEGSYTDQVNAAAMAQKLPCLLEFDGPNIYDYIWSGKIISLDKIPEIKSIRADVTPSIIKQGTFRGKLYSLGQFDSGLAIWGNKKLLNKARIRIPTSIKDAWNLAEFEDALKKLKSIGVPAPLDMKLNYGLVSWTTFGFAPILQSFGGDLIDRKNYQKSDGVLNSAASVKAMKTIQNWAKKGYIDPSTRTDNDFVRGKSALSYIGHWVYPVYSEALGDNLVLIPMPKFGSRIVTGAGSWSWGISSNCKVPQAASKVLAFFLSREAVLRTANANGAMPGRLSAIDSSPYYSKGGPLALFAQQAKEGLAIVRPQTPAFPIIANAFGDATNNILAGNDVKKELDKAAKKIDEYIEDNQGFPDQ